MQPYSLLLSAGTSNTLISILYIISVYLFQELKQHVETKETAELKNTEDKTSTSYKKMKMHISNNHVYKVD